MRSTPTWKKILATIKRVVGWGLSVGLMVFACRGNWPSETPLGQGPKVKAEAKAWEVWRASVDAGKKEAASNRPVSPPRLGAGFPPDGGGGPGAVRDAALAHQTGVSNDAAVEAAVSAKALFWAGLYAGSDVTRLTLPGGMQPPEQKDPNAKTRVEDNPDGTISIVPVDSSNGQDICTLKAKAKSPVRDRFELAPKQPCFKFGNVTAMVDSGQASFAGKHLELKLQASIQPPGAQAPVSLQYEFSGDRP